MKSKFFKLNKEEYCLLTLQKLMQNSIEVNAINIQNKKAYTKNNTKNL